MTNFATKTSGGTDEADFEFDASDLISLNKALDLWVEPGNSRELPDCDRANFRNKALERIEMLKLCTDVRLLPIFWLRLFVESRIPISPTGIAFFLESEQKLQREDKIRLYKRRDISKGNDEKWISVRVERYPGVVLRGFNALEVLVRGPTAKADRPDCWPYGEIWKATIRRRAPKETKVLADPDMFERRWRQLSALLRDCLAQCAKTTNQGSKDALIVKSKSKQKRMYASELRVPQLAQALQKRFKATLGVYSPSTVQRVLHAYVSFPRGRPKSGARAPQSDSNRAIRKAR